MKKREQKPQGKRNWLKTTLLVLVACGVAGAILAAVLFTNEADRPHAQAKIQFAFNGAGQGNAPDGYPFDVNEIASEEVIKTALEATGLQDSYTTEQIQDNLTVTGIYPENIVKMMTKYTSLLDADADQQASMADYRTTQYSVVLYNEFDSKISGGKLTELLKNILDTYRTRLKQQNSAEMAGKTAISDLSGYDYGQQLEIISADAAQLRGYAEEMAALAPEFRRERKGFSDIVVLYRTLGDEIDRLNATITMNGVSKDAERLQTQYELALASLTKEQESLQKELAETEKLLTGYEKDGIVYVSTSGSLSKITGNSSDTYDKLVKKRNELTDKLAETGAEIEQYQTQLTDLWAVTIGKAIEDEEAPKQKAQSIDTAQIQAEIDSFAAMKDEITAAFEAMQNAYTEQQINEGNVTVSQLKFKAPSLLSGTYLKTVIKTAGPLCAVGFMVCVWLIIRTRKKEDKEQQA